MNSQQMSTVDFIKSLSNPHSSTGLSTYVDQINEQVPGIQAEYNQTYLPESLSPAPVGGAYPQQYSPQPLQQNPQQPSYALAPQPAYQPAQQADEGNASYDDNLLEEAYQTTKTMANREQILKENLLQSKQEAYQHKKENYLKDLQIAEYVLGNAAEEQDGQRQAEMVNRISELRSDMMKQELEHKDFLASFQKILDDKPPVMSYTPSYDPEETTYKESPTRQDFRKKNAWYDYENPYYNQNLTQKAHEIEQKMVNEYQLKNMTNYIESPSYFEDLNGRLFKEFGINPPPPQPSMQPQSPTDWQAPMQNQNPQNPFLPAQMPRLDSQQNPYPSMPIQQPYQAQPQPQQYAPQQPAMQPQYMPQQQPQQYGQPNYGPNYGQQPQQAPQQPYGAFGGGGAYGPPVAPVMPSSMPFIPTKSGENINYDPQAVYSKDAYDMFNDTISGLLPNMKNLQQQDKNQFFHTAIKNQGRV